MAKKRSDGRLQRQFRIDGKRYYVYGKNRKELDRNEYELRQRIAAGEVRRSDPTLNQYFEIWTENRRGSVKESTLHKQDCQYRVCAAVVVLDTNKKLGELKLSKITVDDIRTVQRELIKERRTQTVNDAIAVLSHIFRTAVDERRLQYNPCTLVKPLKRTEERARDTHHRALTKEETAAFMAAAEGSFYYDVFRMALNTGMRAGEIGALYNTDIRNGKIYVERTITRKEAGFYEIGEDAKTEKGRRTIPVNDRIREIINHQKRINRMLDGTEPIRDLIFKAPERGLLMSTPINREIKAICKTAGIEYFTMHAFRATFATRAIEQGINPRTVQELLGHADFSITMNLYGHVLDETKTAAMKQLIV